MACLSLAVCYSKSINLQITLALYLLLNFCTVEGLCSIKYFVCVGSQLFSIYCVVRNLTCSNITLVRTFVDYLLFVKWNLFYFEKEWSGLNLTNRTVCYNLVNHGNIILNNKMLLLIHLLGDFEHYGFATLVSNLI